jgi:hypothetical protein
MSSNFKTSKRPQNVPKKSPKRKNKSKARIQRTQFWPARIVKQNILAGGRKGNVIIRYKPHTK